MRTQQEIAARINERKADDFLGFEIGEYINCLSFGLAKPYLVDTATEEEWKPDSSERDDVLKKAQEYLAFAFEKANNNRGISASRSLSHYVAWTWLAGDDEFCKKLQDSIDDDYCYYGKPQLVMIAEQYGWDWKSLDDGRWTNTEDGDGVTADRALRRGAL